MFYRFPPLRLSVPDWLLSPLRSANLLLSGSGSTEFDLDTELPVTLVVRDLVYSGNGTVALKRGGTTIFSLPISGTGFVNFQSGLVLRKGEGMSLTFTGTGSFTLNLLGYPYTG